ncbi:Double-stranded DNA-binding domain protein [uncultured archaeon]|nr:Double-stranded DNA-binding domain protein [uncultured archaeon]
MEGASTPHEEMRKRLEEAQKAQQADAQIKIVLARILEQPAYDRLMNVRISNQEVYAKAVNGLVYMYKKTGRKITERELLTLLSASVERKTGTIEIRRK